MSACHVDVSTDRTVFTYVCDNEAQAVLIGYRWGLGYYVEHVYSAAAPRPGALKSALRASIAKAASLGAAYVIAFLRNDADVRLLRLVKALGFTPYHEDGDGVYAVRYREAA